MVLEELPDPPAPSEDSARLAGRGFGPDVGLDCGVQPVEVNLNGLAVPVGGSPRCTDAVGGKEIVMPCDGDSLVLEVARRDLDESLPIGHRSADGVLSSFPGDNVCPIMGFRLVRGPTQPSDGPSR